VLRILTWLVGAAVASGIFGCAMLVKSEIKVLLVVTCKSVLRVYFGEARSVSGKGRVHCNGTEVCSQRDGGKSGREPFLAPKNRKKGVNVVRRPRQWLRASVDMCNAR